jgi:hypothetical protein
MTYLTYPQLEHCGRLGNQLWEIAGTIGLSRTYGYEPLFPPSWSYRPFVSLPDEMFGPQDQGSPSTRLATHMGPNEQQYLQDWHLFADCADEIRRVFAPSPLAQSVLSGLTEFHALPRPILSVHVRRGDNVFDAGVANKHLYMPERPTGYYLSATDTLREQASTVAVFSDDIPWCRENILADYYHEGVPRPKDGTADYWTATPTDWVDWFLMATCDFHVLSASSYAWWGAFLSHDPSPIYPADWFGPALTHIDTSLMFPPSWREWPSGLDPTTGLPC